jgi:YVTN family beta-propeller protein
LTQITVGNNPQGISIRIREREVYVVNASNNSVSIINADTLKVVDEIATGAGSRAFGSFILE